MTIATIIKFDIILMNTRTETVVSVNNLLTKNTQHLQIYLTLTIHCLYLQLVNTEALVPKREEKM